MDTTFACSQLKKTLLGLDQADIQFQTSVPTVPFLGRFGHFVIRLADMMATKSISKSEPRSTWCLLLSFRFMNLVMFYETCFLQIRQQGFLFSWEKSSSCISRVCSSQPKLLSGQGAFKLLISPRWIRSRRLAWNSAILLTFRSNKVKIIQRKT